MSNRRRPNLPGAAFHITARLQHRAHLFTPGLRGRVVELLERRVEVSDLSLLAYAVMSNHLHLVVVQGHQPLWRFMQPLLRSVALSVHRQHGTEGHVFERRYADRLCRDATHLRNAIAYTHANPVRAGICADPKDYEWTSHRLYMAAAGGGFGGEKSRGPAVCTVEGLAAFGAGRRRGVETAQAALLERVEAVIRTRTVEAGQDTAGRGRGPSITRADSVAGREAPARPRLEDIATAVLGLPGNGSPSLDQLCSPWGPRSVQRWRSRLAKAAACNGYQGSEIAAFLGLSPSTVSRALNRAD